ncbi:vestitone reductase [Cajanus cajan]|uniref:Dihydroflavonol-4-reductase n=1 Tax=Cajanus cajan TaxID=3821 RepID=A0A151TB68_CAJCA|nr:vestitone reductase [Cajanus cajan]KYP64302.1 Dihydroflavonol-4-reductase [Cajanus cajan]
MAEGKGRVCVTGGTGFIASWIIKRLLEDGYAVNTTIRPDPERKRDVSFLTNLPDASEKLKIFEADLSDPESFGPSVEGCIGVFHTATPIDFNLTEPEEALTKRAVDGTLGILRACLKSKTVKRVVYTSSASAVSFVGPEPKDVVDEEDWSDVDFLRSWKPYGWSYAISKTLTEKAALEFGELHGLDVVTLIPPFVVGRFICPKLPDSIEKALVLVVGKKEEIGITRYHMVHGDDVARAHIFLLEHPNPKGRYNCSPFIVPIEDIYQILSAKYPEYKMPTVLEELKQIKGAKLPHLTSKKLEDAGFEFKYSIEDMFVDAIECCKEKGYL